MPKLLFYLRKLRRGFPVNRILHCLDQINCIANSQLVTDIYMFHSELLKLILRCFTLFCLMTHSQLNNSKTLMPGFRFCSDYAGERNQTVKVPNAK